MRTELNTNAPPNIPNLLQHKSAGGNHRRSRRGSSYPGSLIALVALEKGREIGRERERVVSEEQKPPPFPPFPPFPAVRRKKAYDNTDRHQSGTSAGVGRGG